MGKSVSSIFLALVLITSVFAIPVLADSHEVVEEVIANNVDTLILVNNGEISGVDAAIAASISNHLGIPVLYVGYRDISSALQELKDGIYQDVSNVVILGGESVVSPGAENILETSGALSAGYDVTRIAGVTGTGTAVEAIEYFYGPGMLEDVSLVEYVDDVDHSYDDVLHLSSQLDRPIIPIQMDSDGLPADVVEFLDEIYVEDVHLIGEFEGNLAEIEQDVVDLDVHIEGRIGGDFYGLIDPITEEELSEEEFTEYLIGQLHEEIIDNFETGDSITLVESGEVPPALPNSNVFFYDHLEEHDNPSEYLENYAEELFNTINGGGITVEGVRYFGDDEDLLSDVEGALEDMGISTDIGVYGDEGVGDVAYDFSREEAFHISNDFEEGEDEFFERYEQHKLEFARELPKLIEQFKSFYIEEREGLNRELLEIGARIIDEANKGDLAAQWKLMKAFENEYQHDYYVNECDSSCRQEMLDQAEANLDDQINQLVGGDEYGGYWVIGWSIEEKVDFLESTLFVTPRDEDEFRVRIEEAISNEDEAGEVRNHYLEQSREEAYAVYLAQIEEESNSEYYASGQNVRPDPLDFEAFNEGEIGYEERLTTESEAYLSGIIDHNSIRDAGTRAEVYANFEATRAELEEGGVEHSYYLSSEDWVAAYDKYLSEDGITDSDINRWAAAEVAYRTWEESNPGNYEDPTGGYWNSDTGQYSYVDHDGQVVVGYYDSDDHVYTYTDADGTLIQGGSDGSYYTYEHSVEAPEEWTQNDDGSWTSEGGETYTPPVSGEYDPESGSYTYTYVDPETGEVYSYDEGYIPASGGTDWDSPDGWTQNNDGTWVSPDGESYSHDETHPDTGYYDSGGGYYGGEYGGEFSGYYDESGTFYDSYEGADSYGGDYGEGGGDYAGGDYTEGGEYSSCDGCSGGTADGGTAPDGHTESDGGGGGDGGGYVIKDYDSSGDGFLSRWYRSWFG